MKVLYIARDKNKHLYLYFTKPLKASQSWSSTKGDFMELAKSSYRQIKWTDKKPLRVKLEEIR